MATVVTVGTAIVVAAVAASAGYFRRREHLRERRLDAYKAVFAAFLDATRSAADLLTVHTPVGWRRELSAQTWTAKQRQEMTKVHSKAWERAAADRRAFEVAVYGVELVASEDSRADVEELRAFLEGAAYSGPPWKHGKKGETIRASRRPPAPLPSPRRLAGTGRRPCARCWTGNPPVISLDLHGDSVG
jgi:hypothetical protein